MAAIAPATAFFCPSVPSSNELQRAGDISRRRLFQIRPYQSNWASLHSLALAHRREGGSPLFSRLNLRRGASEAAARFFIRQLSGANRSADIHARDKQAFQNRCHRAIPHSLRPSEGSSSAGFKISQKVLQGHGNRTQGRGFSTQGSPRND